MIVLNQLVDNGLKVLVFMVAQEPFSDLFKRIPSIALDSSHQLRELGFQQEFSYLGSDEYAFFYFCFTELRKFLLHIRKERRIGIQGFYKLFE